MKENIINISYIFCAFALVYVANIILGFVQNVVIKKEDFDFNKLLQSIIKLAVYYIVMVGVIAAFSFIDTALLRYNIEISQKTEDAISVLTFAVLYLNAFYKYVKQVIEKVKTGFDIKDEDIISITQKEEDSKK